MPSRPEPCPGRARFPSKVQRQGVAEGVPAGATAVDSKTVPRGNDLRDRIDSQFGRFCSIRGIDNLLRSPLKQWGFELLSPQLRRPNEDPKKARQVLRSAPPLARKVRATRPGKRLRVLFEDEARLGQQGTFASVWAERGTRPVDERQSKHASVRVFSTVVPLTGRSVSMVASRANAFPSSSFSAASAASSCGATTRPRCSRARAGTARRSFARRRTSRRTCASTTGATEATRRRATSCVRRSRTLRRYARRSCGRSAGRNGSCALQV